MLGVPECLVLMCGELSEMKQATVDIRSASSSNSSS